MSQANVDLVQRLQPDPEVDFAQVFRDDDMWAALVEVGGAYHRDVESVRPGLPDGTTYTGLDGLRDMWLEWLAPWKTYRVEAEEVIGLPPLSRTLERLGRKTRARRFKCPDRSRPIHRSFVVKRSSCCA